MFVILLVAFIIITFNQKPIKNFEAAELLQILEIVKKKKKAYKSLNATVLNGQKVIVKLKYLAFLQKYEWYIFIINITR